MVMGRLDVVFRCHSSRCSMFFCKRYAKDHLCTHMCSSLFCFNLANTIDFHDDQPLDRFQEGYDGIGVTMITERVAEDEKNKHFLQLRQ